MFDINKLASIRIKLASPEKIQEWSKGEVKNSETLNYRTQKPEPEGLFCEKIFGPSKDYQCHCGKYSKIKFSGVVCEKCGVEVINKDVRRERMGHIALACPCTHIFYLKGMPSALHLVLEIPPKQLEEIVYYTSHICFNPGDHIGAKHKNGPKELEEKMFINDDVARDVFTSVINEIKDVLIKEDGKTEDDPDIIYINDVLEDLKEKELPLSYFICTELINKWTGATFGEGAEAIETLLKNVDIDKEIQKVREKLTGKLTEQSKIKETKRLQVLNAFKESGNKPEWMILRNLPVIPPDLRPMVALDGGRMAASDINELYRKVILRNKNLHTFINQGAPDVMLFNQKRLLQEAVDALIDNGKSRGSRVQTAQNGRPYKSLSAGLKGKPGRFRANLLGKRVDYSGRSVIAIGPSLKMYQCGLPREMAINLLRPFIAAILIQEGKCVLHKQADKKIDARDNDVQDIVERIISYHPVLLNRAPTLHRLGIQAFQPVLVEGHAIRLHPLVCTGFNADFDGDQMAVHVPLSRAAQEEAINLMLASNNILTPKDGKTIALPSQDILIGNYYLTQEETAEDFKNQAKKLKKLGDTKAAEKYEAFALQEGKVFKDVNEAYKAYDLKLIHLHTRIALPVKAIKKVDLPSGVTDNDYLVTTIGKMIFNLIFPNDFPYINDDSEENLKKNKKEFFVKKGTNLKEYISKLKTFGPVKKKNIGKIIDEVYSRYGAQKTSAILDKLKDNGFRFSTVSGLTISLNDIPFVDSKNKVIKETEVAVDKLYYLFGEGALTEEERHDQVCKCWADCSKQVETLVMEKLKEDPNNPLEIMADSGARGSKSNFTQLSGMRGLMSSTSGETIEIPVKSCFREGLNIAEFFIGTHGARKGGADTALKTADSGYLTRKLVDVSHDVIIREDDCHCDHGRIVKAITTLDALGQPKEIVPLYDRIIGRYSVHPITDTNGEVILGGNELITDEIANKIIKAGYKEVEIRSLLTCQTVDGVCSHCYGINLASGVTVERGATVGVIAAQSIGEPGTQLTMRTFHSGGVAGGDITQGLPRVTELFEARPPKGQAAISRISGTVESIEDDGGSYTITVRNDNIEDETDGVKTIYGAKICVKEGQHVEAGDKLTEGAINPRDLLKYSDVYKLSEYIISEVHKVYRDQSIAISDKHLEVIVRQMLSKLIVVSGGDTDLVYGTKIGINAFNKKNQAVLLEGKRPAVARPLVLGITKAALESDSFLSAASFQETTRILTDAAIKGKIDTLHGLKENVICGKLIPAGTGLISDEEERERLENFNVIKTMNDVKRNYIGVHDINNIDENENDEELLAKESLQTEERYR